MTSVYTVPSGMAGSVFENKYSRLKPDGSYQTWEERVSEVVDGNFSLDKRFNYPAYDSAYQQVSAEYERTRELAVAGIMPFSGRHLQHGDNQQSEKLLELFTNCSTAVFSFMLFRLLLRGSGVGRDYSAACCRVDWSNMPDVRLVLHESHRDFKYELFNGGCMESLRDAQHKYDSESERVRWFVVEDTREGWSKVVEVLETAAWQEKHSNKLFIFDFSQVRASGLPIMGLQGRPASGPIMLMHAIARIASIKSAGMPPWRQALFIDHYLAACVQMGGARRSARMSVKSWRDRDVIDFIDVKRGGFLWSSNNSLTVDEEFWEKARDPRPSHARRVFEAACGAAYFDSTGEPGFINIDKLNNNKDGMEAIVGRNYIDTSVYTDLHPRTIDMADNVLSHLRKLKYPFLTNPCSEIVLSTYGGYCLIGEVDLSKVVQLNDAFDAVDLLARFLVRCNTMRCEYAAEVKRTNRIGVGITGVHEFAWRHFGLTFQDLVAYPADQVAGGFWTFLRRLREAAEHGAREAAKLFDLPIPHTVTTVKPSGSISKIMQCTEGVHLPALAHYLRWVQYKKGDLALDELIARGYPMDDISHRYPDHVVIGFPTRQPILDLMGDKVTCADQTTPEQNFRWLQLLETHWLGSVGENNQISYTLKYDASKISFAEYMEIILEWQPKIRCCAVMPQNDWRETQKVYGYVPEQPITHDEYDEMMARIDAVERERYDDDQLGCESGACPIELDLRQVG